MAFGIPSALSNLLGLDTGDTWQDRLREAAYKSPSGTRIKFLYEDVSRTGTKRGTAFEFPGVDGAYVQQRGVGARRYPLTCYFTGADCDRVATAFEKALYEPGRGKLEHPVYGPVDVVPFGDITRDDRLKTAANQVSVEVTFWTSLESVYPANKIDAKSEIDAALGDFDVEAAQEFDSKSDLSTLAKAANAKGTIKSMLRDVSAALRAASDSVTQVRREFDDNLRLVNFGIDVLIGQPLLLAQQVVNLIKAPGRALAGIQSRLAGYLALAHRIFDSDAGRVEQAALPVAAIGLAIKKKNDFHVADLFAMASVAGSVVAVTNTQFRTKPEALNAAADLVDLFDEVTAWREAALEAFEDDDPGGASAALLRAVSLAAGYLVEVSYQLVPERRVFLDRDRTIVDVAAEFYGVVDEKLDLLIQSNDLTGDEILELQAGRAIVYYPE